MKGHRIGAKQKIGLTVSFVGTGIVICGLNGAGKSTLGKALAEKLDFYFIDNEDLFFLRQTQIISMLLHARVRRLKKCFFMRLRYMKILFLLL